MKISALTADGENKRPAIPTSLPPIDSLHGNALPAMITWRASYTHKESRALARHDAHYRASMHTLTAILIGNIALLKRRRNGLISQRRRLFSGYVRRWQPPPTAAMSTLA